MIITLTPKRASFSAAHSLDCFGAGHKCARKHGHTYWVRASFRGEPDAHGVLIDYAIIPVTIAPLDHVDLDTDVPGLGPATGENLIAWIVLRLIQASDARENPCTLVRVELVEDPIPGDGHTLV